MINNIKSCVYIDNKKITEWTKPKINKKLKKFRLDIC